LHDAVSIFNPPALAGVAPTADVVAAPDELAAVVDAAPAAVVAADAAVLGDAVVTAAAVVDELFLSLPQAATSNPAMPIRQAALLTRRALM
jgi:hypothetical protein